jgi:hypothetical protein
VERQKEAAAAVVEAGTEDQQRNRRDQLQQLSCTQLLACLAVAPAVTWQARSVSAVCAVAVTS